MDPVTEETRLMDLISETRRRNPTPRYQPEPLTVRKKQKQRSKTTAKKDYTPPYSKDQRFVAALFLETQ